MPEVIPVRYRTYPDGRAETLDEDFAGAEAADASELGRLLQSWADLDWDGRGRLSPAPVIHLIGP